MPQPVVHWEIAARDSKKLQDFFAQLFNWRLMPFDASYTMVETGGSGGINGGIMQAQPQQPSTITLYVMVDDLEAYLAKAESLGGQRCLPPTPIPNIGSFAIALDPEGHCLGLFKPNTMQPPPPCQPHNGRPVVWFEITAKDGKRVQEFYAKLFDWNVNVNPDTGYGEVQPAGPHSIGGGIMQARDLNCTYVTFYVQVDDLTGYLNKAASLGGRIMLQPMPIPGVGQIAFFADPEGHPIGLYNPTAKSSPES